MAHHEAGGYRATVQFPRKPMRSYAGLTAPELHNAVASWILAAEPGPAALTTLHACPEELLGCLPRVHAFASVMSASQTSDTMAVLNVPAAALDFTSAARRAAPLLMLRMRSARAAAS